LKEELSGQRKKEPGDPRAEGKRQKRESLKVGFLP
jgi:hypothetical protein